MSCSITINQTQEVTKVVEVAEVVKKPSKHPGRVASGKRLAEWNKLKKLGLVTEKAAKITLKSILDEIKRDLNDPAAVLTAIDETIHILEKDYKTEVQIKLEKM